MNSFKGRSQAAAECWWIRRWWASSWACLLSLSLSLSYFFLPVWCRESARQVVGNYSWPPDCNTNQQGGWSCLGEREKEKERTKKKNVNQIWPFDSSPIALFFISLPVKVKASIGSVGFRFVFLPCSQPLWGNIESSRQPSRSINWKTLGLILKITEKKIQPGNTGGSTR